MPSKIVLELEKKVPTAELELLGLRLLQKMQLPHSNNSAAHSVNFAKLGIAYVVELDK